MIKLYELTKEEIYESYNKGNTDIDLMIEYIVNVTKTNNILVNKIEELQNKIKILENK